MENIGIIGAGFSSLSVATHLAHAGYQVHVFDNHTMAGGRARKFKKDGFVFDMGPSWYWMPDVFEKYFGDFGKKPEDYYDLIRLDPSYKIFFPNEDVNIPANLSELKALFESWEPGAGAQLENFLNEASVKYDLGMNKLVLKPGKNLMEYAEWDVFKNLFKLNIFNSFKNYTEKYFKDKRILQILEFPILFLGATAQTTPALYSLMNFADIKLGTWYPQGGMHKIVEGMQKLAVEKGVTFHFNATVHKINTGNDHVQSLLVNDQIVEFDQIVAGADYHFVEQKLLDKPQRNYSEKYWQKRDMAPSSLIFYLGVDDELPNLEHHNLFFDEDFATHAKELYQKPSWPTAPLFYACVPSKTDPSVAPKGKENIFILMPVAPGIEDNEALHDHYYNLIINRMEKRMGKPFKDKIILKRTFSVDNFKEEYNAFKGNAYGLSNTLMQTAIFKPKLKNKKVKGLYYTGQLTVPGPGVPPSLISGKLVANEIIKSK